jgi:dnd system-associated protein 4
MMRQDLGLKRDLAYDKEYEADYNALTGKDEEIVKPFKDSPFLRRTNRDIFLYSLALGYYHKRRVPLKNPRNNISSEALKQDGEWLVYSVAIAEEKDLSILLDMKKVARIAEEYANGGFPILKELIKHGLLADPDRRMESDLRRVWEKVRKNYEGNQTIESIRTQDTEAEASEADKDDSMKIIEKLENTLRNLVMSKLSVISSNWMKDRIPSHTSDMVDRWERNRVRNIRGHNLFRKGENNDHLINYSELGDLYEIIKWNKNWKECFEPIFEDRKIFEADMEQLLMIRPDKAHSRPLNNVQITKLKAIAFHFLTLIEKASETRT